MVVLCLLLGACASTPAESSAGATPDPTATRQPVSTDGDAAPTPLAVPTPRDLAGDETSGDETAGDETEPTPTEAAATVEPSQPTATATAAPIPTATASPAPTAAPTATPRPQPTATPKPQPTPVPPTPTPVWVNPDCYVGPGAADEPVWWCGGKICQTSAPHFGCPRTPPVSPARPVHIDCSISDTTIVVGEVITLKAIQDPFNLEVRYAFSHGDGTIDHTAESYAYYREPGSYTVKLIWQHSGTKGTIVCGTVTVTGNPVTPTPTPTPPTVQIGCTISPSRTVKVNETLVFEAFQDPQNVPVAYVFDHGDGTLDPTNKSHAYYAAPGFYEVRLQWAHSGTSGTTFCGTVTVEPAFNSADYVGRSQASATTLATSLGLVVRVTRIDDEYFPGTDDYRLDRVNFEIDNGVVTKATLG